MNEQREDEFTIDESKVKDALVALSQQKVSELAQQNLILQANYQVVLAERVQMPDLIAENKELQKTIDEYSKKGKLDISKLKDEQVKSQAELEHATTDMQNMTNKIDTFYKPKIRELEGKVAELQELIPEDSKTIPKK
jgi:polyhydroxyalkanoate synthesis regulator phasin